MSIVIWIFFIEISHAFDFAIFLQSRKTRNEVAVIPSKITQPEEPNLQVRAARQARSIVWVEKRNRIASFFVSSIG